MRFNFDKYKKLLIAKYNMSQNSFDENLNNWIKKRENLESSKRDFIWSCFNFLLLDYSKNSNDEIAMYNSQKDIYWDMRLMLIDEGRDSKHIIKVINFIFLKISEINDNNAKFESELVIIGTKCCEECNKIDGIKTTIRKELANQLLPYNKCTRESGCICCYADLFKRGENGRLIRKRKPS